MDIRSDAEYDALGGGLAATFTFTFNKPVLGFDASDIVVEPADAGAISDFSGDPGSDEYTAVFTAAAFHGDATIRVAHDSFMDTEDRMGIGRSFEFEIDNEPPTIVYVEPRDNLFNAQNTLAWLIVFSEPVVPPPDVFGISPALTAEEEYIEGGETAFSFLYFLRGGALAHHAGAVGIVADPDLLARIVDQNGNPLSGGFPDNPPTITLTNLAFGTPILSANYMAGEAIPTMVLPEATGAIGTITYTLTGPGR